MALKTPLLEYFYPGEILAQIFQNDKNTHDKTTLGEIILRQRWHSEQRMVARGIFHVWWEGIQS